MEMNSQPLTNSYIIISISHLDLRPGMGEKNLNHLLVTVALLGGRGNKKKKQKNPDVTDARVEHKGHNTT